MYYDVEAVEEAMKVRPPLQVQFRRRALKYVGAMESEASGTSARLLALISVMYWPISTSSFTTHALYSRDVTLCDTHICPTDGRGL